MAINREEITKVIFSGTRIPAKDFTSPAVDGYNENVAGSEVLKFDAAKAKEVLQVYANAADKMHTYFPENSKTGGETTAAPKIWESQAEFRKRFDDWAADIKTASAQTNDLDSFKAAFGNVTKSCGGCHETFRIKKS